MLVRHDPHPGPAAVVAIALIGLAVEDGLIEGGRFSVNTDKAIAFIRSDLGAENLGNVEAVAAHAVGLMNAGGGMGGDDPAIKSVLEMTWPTLVARVAP